MSYTEIPRNILEVKGAYDAKYRRKYIVQICECVEMVPYGTIKHVFRRYPTTNTYLSKKKRLPGSISIFDDLGEDTPVVVHLYAHYFYGQSAIRRCREPRDIYDNLAQRKVWFRMCLMKLASSLSECGDAVVYFQIPEGADSVDKAWTEYKASLRSFAKHFRVKVVVCTALYHLRER